MSLDLYQWYRIGFATVLILWSGWFSRHIYQDYQIYQNNYVSEISALSDTAVPNLVSKPVNLAAFHLMGEPQKTLIETQQKAEKLQETRLDLELRGVFDSQGPMLGGAVIETGTREPGFFQIGDLIAEDVTFAAIEGQTIIIDRNGKMEKLSYDRSLVEFNIFSRARNDAYINTPPTENMGVDQQDKLITRQPSLEDRLAKLRNKHHRNN